MKNNVPIKISSHFLCISRGWMLPNFVHNLWVLICWGMSGKSKQMVSWFTEMTHNMILTITHCLFVCFLFPLWKFWKQIYFQNCTRYVGSIRTASCSSFKELSNAVSEEAELSRPALQARIRPHTWFISIQLLATEYPSKVQIHSTKVWIAMNWNSTRTFWKCTVLQILKVGKIPLLLFQHVLARIWWLRFLCTWLLLVQYTGHAWKHK